MNWDCNLFWAIDLSTLCTHRLSFFLFLTSDCALFMYVVFFQLKFLISFFFRLFILQHVKRGNPNKRRKDGWNSTTNIFYDKQIIWEAGGFGQKLAENLAATTTTDATSLHHQQQQQSWSSQLSKKLGQASEAQVRKRFIGALFCVF